MHRRPETILRVRTAIPLPTATRAAGSGVARVAQAFPPRARAHGRRSDGHREYSKILVGNVSADESCTFIVVWRRADYATVH